METEKVHLTNEKETYLATLCGKALDNRSENPILGDKFADEVVHHIDFDFEKLKVPKGSEITLPMRAKHLPVDQVVPCSKSGFNCAAPGLRPGQPRIPDRFPGNSTLVRCRPARRDRAAQASVS